jgi:tetratricopeptide (TPR) repeat protein
LISYPKKTNMTTRTSIVCLLACSFNLLAASPEVGHQQKLEMILDRVYRANGNFTIAKPTIRSTTETLKGATYYRRTNLIEVDDLMLRTCASMGSNSDDALAFIIAHELCHAYQGGAREVGFLFHCRTEGSSTDTEREADISGAFCAYLAGYNNTLALLPELLERIYLNYQLKGRELDGYPSLKERKQTSSEVAGYVGRIIDLFELGNYLVVIGRYELAALTYGQITDVYQGAMLYNNLGVCRTLQAVFLQYPPVDPYVFPLEMGVNLPLRIPELSRSETEMDDADWRQRRELLDAAENYFKKALALDEHLLTAEINLACAFTLNGKAKQSEAYIVANKLTARAASHQNPNIFLDKVNLCLSLAKAYQRNPEAVAVFNTLRASSDAFVSSAAAHNLAVIEGRTPPVLPECQLPDNYSAALEGVRPALSGGHNETFYPLSGTAPYDLSLSYRGGATVYVFRLQGNVILMLKKVRNKSARTWYGKPISSLPTDEGVFSVCPEKQLAYRYNQRQHRIVEWVQYWE